MADDGSSDGEKTGNQGGDTGTKTDGGTVSPPEISDEQLQKLADDPRFQKLLQSEKDKAVSTIERRMQVEQRARLSDIRRQREEAELASLAEDENFEELGRRTATKTQQLRQLKETAMQVSAEIEAMLLERPELKVLGEDALKELYEDVRARGGNVVDLMTSAASTLANKQVELAVEKARKAFQDDLEALRIELGVKTREGSTGASGGASGATGTGVGGKSEDDVLADPNTPISVIREILKKRGIEMKV